MPISAKHSLNASHFWDYSLEVYAKGKVQNSLIQLQDDYQLNVNVLLLMMYLDKQRIALECSQFQALKQSIAGSDAQLIEFRRKRRHAKSGDELLYKALLEEELALEKQQQQLLINCVNSLSTKHLGVSDQEEQKKGKQAFSNLLRYVEFCNIPASSEELISELHSHV
jgi:uncharacterized protein (TIGR02444 family)